MATSFNNKKDFSFTITKAIPTRHKSSYFMSVIFFLLLVGGYIIFHSSTIFTNPNITLEEPKEGALVQGQFVAIRGTTDPKTRMTVNNYESFSDDDGKFDLTLPFPKGYNIVDIRVKNRIGKEAQVVRHIVVE